MSNDGQLERHELADMNHEEIVAAERTGRLDKMLGRDYKLTADEIRQEATESVRADLNGEKQEPAITRKDLARMKPDEVLRLYREGSLDHLTNGSK